MFIRSIVIALILFGSAAPALAQASPARASTITAATPTPDDRARQWLVLVDDKNYAQSWSEAGKAFQNRQKADAWASDATAKRESFGAVASRDLKSVDLGRSNIAVVRYTTVFAHKAPTVETVTLAFDNGGWSVTDYAVN
jgi:hypothetical protein